MPLYLFPVIMGLAGLLFARGLDNPTLRLGVIVVSVAVPLFAGGHFVSTLRGRRFQRVLLLIGILMLIVGAVAVALLPPIPPGSTQQEAHAAKIFYQEVSQYAHWLGLPSLLLGLLVILYSVLKTEESIREFGDRFGPLAECMGEGFALAASDGLVVFVNERLLKMTGLTKEKFVNCNIADLAIFDPVKHAQAPDGENQPFVGETAWLVEGEEHFFRVLRTDIASRRGRPQGILLTLRDVTQEHRMGERLEHYAQGLQLLVEDQTQKLRESEKRLRNLLINMNEGLVTLDGTFKIRFVNDRMGEMLGLTTDTLVGTEIFSWVSVEERARLLNILRRVATQREVRMRQEFTLLKTDAVPVPVVMAVALVTGMPDEELRYSLVVTEVTELKAVQKELELRAEELENANEELRFHDRAKDAFLSNVTHELRTPLTTIQGYVEMMQSDTLGELSAPTRAALNVVGRNLDRLSALINEMIEFSRMEIRGIKLDLSLFSIEQLVQECIVSQRPQATVRDISLNAFVHDNMPYIWGDRSRMAQVIANLISNAIKFSDSGAIVQIAIATDPLGITLAVSDTGIGILPKFYEQIFTKFFQVDSSRNRKYEGAGIGLSVARSIAEAHGGHIELESQQGVGSTFKLVLPDACFDWETLLVAGRPLDGKRAMVCGSSASFTDALAAFLRACGAVVTPVLSGHESKRIAAQIKPNILIADDSMPDVSGFSLIEALATQESTKNLPVLIAHQSGQKYEAPTLGAPPWTGILEKPFTPRELAARIGTLCGIEGWIHSEDDSGKEVTPNILVVGPDRDFLHLMACALRKHKIACREALGIGALSQAVQRWQPAVIFADIDEHEIPEILSVLSACNGATPIPLYVVSDAHPSYHTKRLVAGMVHKPFSIDEFIACAKEALEQNGPGQTPTTERKSLE